MKKSLLSLAFVVAVLGMAPIPASATHVAGHQAQCLSTTTTGGTTIGSTQRWVKYSGSTSTYGGIYLNLNATVYCAGAFPGGTMYFNTVKCSDNSTISSERAFFAGSLDKYIATDVLSGTCFKVRWRGGNTGGFKGVIFWHCQTSPCSS